MEAEHLEGEPSNIQHVCFGYSYLSDDHVCIDVMTNGGRARYDATRWSSGVKTTDPTESPWPSGLKSATPAKNPDVYRKNGCLVDN
ncbi:Uncharacterized protein HZ326_25559 [Fusarium oxysporum f. sp. albedinis]|nr:Uncharacterized protein HZ326_25559 [Fusarium oxysporum f. sp. albedinis]